MQDEILKESVKTKEPDEPMYIIKIKAMDLGQIIDGIRCRAEDYRQTEAYHRNDDTADGNAVILEVKDAEEAKTIAEHYESIIETLERQMRQQRVLAKYYGEGYAMNDKVLTLLRQIVTTSEHIKQSTCEGIMDKALQCAHILNTERVSPTTKVFFEINLNDQLPEEDFDIVFRSQSLKECIALWHKRGFKTCNGYKIDIRDSKEAYWIADINMDSIAFPEVKTRRETIRDIIETGGNSGAMATCITNLFKQEGDQS